MAEYDVTERDEKYGDRAVRVNSPLTERMGDFWFYHKGKVIVGVILLLLLILTVTQIVGKRNNDVMIAYSGPAYLSGAEQEALQDLLSTVVGSATEDRSFLIGVTQYQVYSKEQIESLRAETHEDGEQNFINSEFNSENYENFYSYVMTGDTAILFLDPWLYTELRKNDRLLSMTELFGSVPLYMEGEGFGIVLGDIPLYQESAAMQKLPANTVMCFLKPYVFGNTSKNAKYETMKEVFRAIVTCEPEADLP